MKSECPVLTMLVTTSLNDTSRTPGGTSKSIHGITALITTRGRRELINRRTFAEAIPTHRRTATEPKQPCHRLKDECSRQS